jgi:hypothetical protein
MVSRLTWEEKFEKKIWWWKYWNIQ